MFVPVSGSTNPIKPKRGFLTARPVVRSDDPGKSESAENLPRWQDGHTEDASHPGDGESSAAPSGKEAAAQKDEPFQENADLARHLLLQRAGLQANSRPGEAASAPHGYEEARSLQPGQPTAAAPRTAPDGAT